MGQHGLVSSSNSLLYDSILRVPLIVAGLRGQKRGYTSKCLAELTDIVPTVLELLNMDVPEHIDGKSLKLQLKPNKIYHREAAFAQGKEDIRVIRTLNHKLIETRDDELRRLYNLESDPNEFKNIIDNRHVEHMKKKMISILHHEYDGNY